MDIFYHFPKSKKLKKELLNKSILLADVNKIYVEELDCDISFRRTPTSKPKEEILKLALENKSTHYFFIKRNFGVECFFEIGAGVNFEGKEYFIFIYLTEETGKFLIKKYKLKKI